MAIAEWFDSTKDSHQVDVAKFSKEGRDALKAFAGESKIDSMASIRINGNQRVWAVREGDVFAIVWWDPEHAVCEAKLKHTER